MTNRAGIYEHDSVGNGIKRYLKRGQENQREITVKTGKNNEYGGLWLIGNILNNFFVLE